MNYKKILLLFGALALSSSAQFDDKIWECQHGKTEIPLPVAEEVEEPDYNPEGNDHTGRNLASYNNFRMYGYYGAVGSGTFANYIKNELIPPIIDYWSAALKIKYPVSGALKVSASSVCGVATPSILRAGVAADFVYVVTTDSSTSYVASSAPCSMAAGTNRPIVGHTAISSHWMQATSDVLLHERNMICIMHEIVHTLGWTTGMYSSWLNYETGVRMGGNYFTTGLDGASSIVLEAEPLRTMVREHFGCSSMAGAYMENNGGAGNAGCHFERRHFAYEAMTSGLIYQMQFSKFTLGLLESTGWYAADYSYADPLTYGQGQGCGFLTDSCSAANRLFTADLCSTSNRGCTSTGRGGANCQTDAKTDGCQYWFPEIDYDCENSQASAYSRLAGLQTFGRGTGSKCFTGTLSSGGSASQTNFCFKSSCSGSGSSTVLYLTVGTKQVACTREGPVSVSGYGGSVNCPDPVAFCTTIGAKVCPRNCMGRGTCVNGKCVCNSGASGEDCGLVA